jgi:hypothetical protein
MAKKGLDEDRLKFFKGMGETETSESDKTGSDETGLAISESGRSESGRSESVKMESAISESDKIDSVLSESDKTESDKTESKLSESDNRESTNRRRKQATKITLPKSRAHSTTPKIRAKKVDDSVLDQAISAASKSPKVSIYSPFVAAVMKCNELTTIGYKSSADSRELLEKALEQAYPDVCEKVRRYMENK